MYLCIGVLAYLCFGVFVYSCSCLSVYLFIGASVFCVLVYSCTGVYMLYICEWVYLSNSVLVCLCIGVFV